MNRFAVTAGLVSLAGLGLVAAKTFAWLSNEAIWGCWIAVVVVAIACSIGRAPYK